MNKKLVLTILLLILTLTSACGQNATSTPILIPPTAVPSIAAPTEHPTTAPTKAPAVTETASEPATTEPEPVAEPAADAEPLLEIDWGDREIFRAGLIQAEQVALDDLPGASVYHIDFTIADDMFTLTGRQQVHYTNREDAPLGEIYFQTFPNIAGGATRITAAQIDGQAVTPVFEFKDSAFQLLLPAALQPGQSTIIDLSYEVQVAQEMGGNYGLFGYFDDILVLDEFYPVIPAYDQDEGWNVKAPPPNGDLTHFDASFYLVRVTAPAELVMIAAGRQIDRAEADNQQTVTYAAGPVRDFYLAASEHFVVINQQLGETTVNSYAFPELEEMSTLALETAVGALQVFGERFGPYPYTEFDVVSTPMLALGIEYPGIVGITLNLYDPEAIVSGLPSQNLMVTVVAHEAGHQWFYNTVGNDQVDEPWLDEAVVQFCTNLFYEDFYSSSAAEQYRGSWDYMWGKTEMAKLPIGLPSGDYEEGFYSGIVYGRGPYFVTALKDEMGEKIFDAFMRDYYQTYKWDIGTGKAFRQLAEKHCNCDLTELWDEWVY